jgi:hypothetical protein
MRRKIHGPRSRNDIKDRNDYSNKIRAAARELEHRGLLLSEDVAIIVHAAAETTVPK